MTLELIEHDVPSGGEQTLVAVSTSYSSLKRYCKDTFGQSIWDKDDDVGNKFYTIERTGLVIVKDDNSKYNQ